MKAVVQRCRHARVEVEGQIVGSIESGLAVFVGVANTDTEETAVKMAQKLVGLRIFSDESGRFQHALGDVEGEILLVSNFTLCGDARKGNRPNFMAAASPDEARRLYEKIGCLLQERGVRVARGSFGAEMQVFVENDGPVTILLEL